MRSIPTSAARRAAAFLALSAPALLSAYYIFSYSIDIPYYDEWAMVPMVDRWLSGHGAWSDLFIRQGGHVIALQRAITILSAELFGWDIRIEILVGFFFLVATALLLIRQAVRTGLFTAPAIAFPAILAVMSVLFGLRQWENLLAPWSINPFGSTFFALTSFYFLSKDVTASFFLILVATASALLASLTFTNGLLVWPIGILIIIATRKAKPLLLITWLAATALCVTIYAVGSATGSAHLVRIGAISAFRGLAVLGAQFSADKSIITGGATSVPSTFIDGGQAIALGLALIAAVAWALWRARHSMSPHAFSISVILFGLGSCAFIAAGRADLGILQSTASRYTSTSGLVVIGLLLLIAELTTKDRTNQFNIGSALVAAVLVSASYGIFAELALGPARRQAMTAWANHIRQYQSAIDADLKNPHYTPEQIRKFSTILQQHKLSVFSRSSDH